MKIVLLGPPGAGKGTQAKLISKGFSIPHISTGDIFRKNISEETPLGVQAKKFIDKGLLVPDEVTIDITKDRLSRDDCKSGFLLDGFPRTVFQAESLDDFLRNREEDIDSVLLIGVPSEFILERMTGRRVCLNCGASYHTGFNPTKVAGICDVCGSEIIQRDDDKEATVKERIDVYEKSTQPLIDYYDKVNKLFTLDGTKSIEEVFEDISNHLAQYKVTN
jgi:adenylate kinase